MVPMAMAGWLRLLPMLSIPAANAYLLTARLATHVSHSSTHATHQPVSVAIRPGVMPPRKLEQLRMGLLDALQPTKKAGGSDGEFYNSDANKQLIEGYTLRAERINELEDEIELLDDEQLAQKTVEFRERISNGESEDDLLEEAFAVVREAAWRTLELRHYDVQLVGGMALHEGKLAQMGTGEGKTLVATLAVYLNALSGKGAFVVTVNDYLARRDAETMGQVYSFLGLSVGLVQTGQAPADRKAAYACDVTYVTNSELGFDYLRDNLATSVAEVVLPPTLNYCVVDEGDSVLIDEARVPLIISGRVDAPTERYAAAAKLANAMAPDVHYTVFEKDQNVQLTEEGARYCEAALQLSSLYDPKAPWASYVINALKAKELFVKDRSYLVRDGEALIIDEFSGRVMEGRRWSDGLHQSVEAKEGLTVQPETEVVASVTYQSLFRRFAKLASMSGTALTEAREFATIYNLDVVDVPPALPLQRVDIPASVYKTTRGKSNAALQELLALHRQGRPVLVGTTSVESSNAFSEKLDELGIAHQVLSADPKSADREAEIVAQAGRAGVITIATNMAGRGTDILLGGNPAFMARLQLRSTLAKAAGLEVTSPAADFYPCELSAEASAAVSAASKAWCALTGASSGEEVDAAALAALDETLAVAASAAAVEEGGLADVLREAFEAVKDEYDAALAPERQAVLESGGLHVIGTNLHDSRRIDDQLRGRAGRQGDPGSTHFFLSLEDRIFRVFGGDKVKGVLDFLRVSEDQPLESDQVTKVVEDTQAKVERFYYELRQKLFEFDEVIAVQRERNYARRSEMLRAGAEQTRSFFLSLSQETARDILKANWKNADGEPLAGAATDEVAEMLVAKLLQFFPAADIDAKHLAVSKDAAESYVLSAVEAALAAKHDSLEAVRSGLGVEAMRYLALVQTDLLWKAHLKNMNYVKEFAGLKAYAQMDPLTVYREEGLKYYDSMLVSFRQNTVYSFFQYQAKQ
uniref:Protein translocase subunit SecA n=1 Tax=Chrysotila carterae TaxID=13221 RepID=A0A7S4BQD3_CHRCT